MPTDYEYRCGVCGRHYWLRDMTVSPPDAPCSDECREAKFEALLQRVVSQLGTSTAEERELLDEAYHDDCG